ncbi:MAG TPA: hypothetical protein VGB06_01440 [Solirubrobacterales bacterium]
MNAERLHAIVESLKAEVAETNYPQLLDQLVEGLKSSVEAPNKPGPQEQASKAREQLHAVLGDAASNDFSPAWRQSLEEMGIADLLGESLAEEVERILSANEVTPTAAANELGEIRERVQRLVSALDQVSSALTFLQIGREELSPGDFEVGFLIPRSEVDNGLGQLGKEFMNLKRIVAPFSELAGESRPEVEVRSISSSEFQVFLDSAPGTAALITVALERLTRIYQQILDIRLKHQELSEADDVPDEVLKPLADHVSERIEAEISDIADEVVEKATLVDEARLNELRTELKHQLSALADRIDRGFNVEVRAGEIPRSTDDEIDEDDKDREVREAAETVLKARKSLEFMNVSGKPILHLEQPEDPTDDNGTTDAG